MAQASLKLEKNRRSFISGSDALTIMGNDKDALLRLWCQKRGEVGRDDLSGDLVVQLDAVTEDLNRRWFERNTGQTVTSVHRRVQHAAIPWIAAILGGIVAATGAVFEAKFMLSRSFSEETAAERFIAQLQHNMWVTQSRQAVVSIITGDGKWVEITVPADPLYQTILIAAEKKFWRGVKDGVPPCLYGFAKPLAQIEAVRIVDITASNTSAW